MNFHVITTKASVDPIMDSGLGGPSELSCLGAHGLVIGCGLLGEGPWPLTRAVLGEPSSANSPST